MDEREDDDENGVGRGNGERRISGVVEDSKNRNRKIGVEDDNGEWDRGERKEMGRYKIKGDRETKTKRLGDKGRRRRTWV